MGKDIYFDKLCEMIYKAKEEKELSNVESIYSYGSIASGEFIPGYSDVDLFVIINDSRDERVKTEREIIENLTTVITRFTSFFSSQEIQNHNPTIMTVNEFRNHCVQFPTRVLYPLKNNVWKTIIGKKVHDNLNLPDEDTLNKHKAIDFDLFSRKWYETVLYDNLYDAKKYYLRALKKYIWICYGEYVERRSEVLDKMLYYHSNNKVTLDLIENLKKVDNNKLYGEEFINLYHQLNVCLLEYGKQIRKKIEKKENKISEFEFYNVSLWGDYSWELRQILNLYHKITLFEPNRLKYIDFLTKEYFLIIDFFLFAASIPKKTVRFGRRNMNEVKRSYIYNYNVTDFSKIIPYLGQNAFHTIFIMHRVLINEKFFENLTLSELIDYIENKYLPDIKEIYDTLLL